MALDFPNTPTNGQTYNSAGVSWQWDGAKWLNGGNTGFLPLIGGTINPGPLLVTSGTAQAARSMTLLGDPTGSTGEVSMEGGSYTVRLGYAQPLGSVVVAAIGSQATNRIEIKAATVPSPGPAVFLGGSDADADLGVYGRGTTGGTLLGGTPNANRPRAFGTATGGSPGIAAGGISSDSNINLTLAGKGTGGVIVANGTAPSYTTRATFTGKGNLMLGVAEPATLSAATAADGGVLRAWYVVANNYMTGMYWDGISNRRLNATGSPGQIALGGGTYTFYSGAVGAADSVVTTLNTLATLDGAGAFTATGSVWATNRAGAFGLNDFGGGYWGLRFSADGWRIQWNSANGNLQFVNSTSTNLWLCDGGGNITVPGTITCGVVYPTSVTFTGTVQGPNVYANSYLYSAGNGRCDGEWYSGGRLYSNNGRVMAINNNNNPCISCYNTATGCTGWWFDGSSNFCWGACDGNGNPSAGWGYTNSTTFRHNTDISCGRNLSASALFSATIVNSGNIYSAGGWFLGGNGDTNIGLYLSGSDRIWQSSGNWYWRWAASGGDMSWFAGGATVWQMRQGSDWLVWNPTGTVGGNGGYYNFSDRRMKENIEPATEGLAEILQLKPMKFDRVPPVLGKDAARADGSPLPQMIRPSEIGFIAQDVAPHLPEAVFIVGQELPDGKGGLDDVEPTLALTYDTITATLVNAVKELSAKIDAIIASMPPGWQPDQAAGAKP